MRTFLIVAIAAITTSLPAVGEDEVSTRFVGQEVDTSFEVVKAQVEASGYRDVERINGDTYRLSAFDQAGSQVQLSINPQTGEIVGAEHLDTRAQ